MSVPILRCGQLRSLFVSVLLLCCCFNSSHAQTFTYKTSEASAILTGDDLYAHGFTDTMIVWCNEWDLITPTTTWGTALKFKSKNAFVKFSVNNYSLQTNYQASVAYTYHLLFHVLGYTNLADTLNTFVSNSDTLTISYNNTADNTPYQDLNLKKYSNFYKLMVVVDQVLIDSAGFPVLATATMADPAMRNFSVEGSILTQHYDKAHYGAGISPDPLTVTTVPHPSDNYLDLSWNYPPPAISPVNYELEWTYVDDYSVSLLSGTSIPIPASSLSYDFSHNSTKVWLDSNKYRIPLIYPNGYVIYRVRTVRPDSIQFKYPVYGDWTIPADHGSISSLNLPAQYYPTSRYAGDSLNWQYTVSFAEGGKYKHVASFYDGLLKNRQSITRFNSSLNKLIVTNNVYDYEGRLCIKTLPAPVIANSFGYQHNVDLNSITGQPYQAADFDSGWAVCPNNTPVAPLAANALASVYYSPRNPDTVANTYQKYVPDAEGYPFVQTVYQPGYNDRVAAQGGAGPKLQVGDSNYIANSYVSPGQQVLNSLFGPNIGWSSYYTMTVSRDPNQQLSMSVKDYEGRQMVSAMIGAGPDSTNHAITSISVPSPTYFKQDLLLPNTPNQLIDSIAGTRTADNDFFNEVQSTDDIQYLLSFTPFGICSKYLAVKGHLACNITDQCGNLVWRHDTTLGVNGFVASGGPLTFTDTVGHFYAQAAPYHVHKILSFYPWDVDAAMDSFFSASATPNCFLTEPHFIKQSVDSAIFPCPGSITNDSDNCSKMKWEMMQQLFPGAVYGKYNTIGGSAIGTDNSVFSMYGCPFDTFHAKRYYYDTLHYCHNPYGVVMGNLTWHLWQDPVHIHAMYTTVQDTSLGWSQFRITTQGICSYFPTMATYTSTVCVTSTHIVDFVNVDTMNGTISTPFRTYGKFNFNTGSDSLAGENGDIVDSATGSVIGSISTNSHLTQMYIPCTYSSDSIKTNITGVLPSGGNVHIIILATNNVFDSSYLTFPTFIDSFYVDSLVPHAASPLCHYRYKDTCTVSSLKDTITVAGVFYHGLRTTMPVDSFVMVYNAAIAEGNYSIAEALLPLHPQYCELQNCFNDTFKTQALAIPNWQVAGNLNLLYLDDLVAHDPLKTMMSGYPSLFPNPDDSLKTFTGGTIRLDSFIFMNAYCSCSDSTMFGQCVTGMFSNEISHHLLINSSVKDFYFQNIMNAYFTNRQHFIDKIFMKDGNTCSHCAVARMIFDPAAAIPPAPYPPDTAIASIPGSGSSGWMTTISTDSITALTDSAQALYHYTDSMLTRGVIDTVMAHLSNCIAGNSTLATNIKNSLIGLYNSGAVSQGNFTYPQIHQVLAGNGVSFSDLCNPYVFNFSQLGATPPVNSCMAPAFYTGMGSFINNTNINGTLRSPGTTYSGFVLDTVNNIFERNVARSLGYNVADITTAYNSTQQLYTISLVRPGGGGTVQVFLHAPTCGNAFSTLGTYSVGADCINSSPSLASATGLINQYSFLATITPASGTPCTMTGWVDSVQTMGHLDATIGQCMPCTQMRDLYTQFNDTLLAYGITGTDHPCYDLMLGNFMNDRLQQQYSSSDYETFIESCALADSMKIPLYAGYSTYTFANTADMNSFIYMLDHVDTHYSFDNSYRDSAASVITVCVDLNTVPTPELWKYKDALANYTGTHSSRIINASLATIKTAGEIGFLYSNPAYPFDPRTANIIDTTNVKFVGPYNKAVWMGGHFVMQGFYDVVAQPGTPPYEISKDVYNLTAYIYNHNVPGAVFTPLSLSTVNADYFTPQKQAYLKYTYGFQQLPEYQVLDSIQAQNLKARIPSYATYLPGYSQSANPGVFTSLYLGNAGMNNRFYDSLQKIITLSGVSGGIFHALNHVSIPLATGVPGQLDAYICGDDSYWYRYFGVNDTLYNVYVSFPAYIPKYLRPSYKFVGSVIPTPGDSLNRCFAIKVLRAGSSDTLQLQGRASFVIGKSIALTNVLMGQAPGGVNVVGADTFNNCERQTLLSAVNIGVANYNNYMDSVKAGTKAAFQHYVANTVQEKLLIGYMNDEFSYTLYNYDRAGNLAYTVPPAGIVTIPVTGGLLDQVDNNRTNNTPGAAIANTKINTYTYNTLNQVREQKTIDGGKTRFMYDAAGRLIFSQNAKQALKGFYTYNIYDDQNRITETGEEQLGCTYFDPYTVNFFGGSMPACYHSYALGSYTTSGGIFVNPYQISPDPYFIHNLINVPYDSVVHFIRSYNRDDVVMTIYDTAAKNLKIIKGLDAQENLRKRVSCVKYFESLSIADVTYKNYTYATHYSYDIDGNVETLTQDFPELASVKQQYKRIDYDYDVISGKVNMLSYNRGWPDQYYQQYSYDADNRITQVQTSADGFIWKKDASYSYYEHGPLARVQLGNLGVQGVDYAYTIQGWLKVLNTDTLNSNMDMGNDGITGGVIAPDAVAYTVDYFKNDYKSITGRAVAHVTPVTKSLYNGNIARQTEAINAFQKLNKQYVYDQLNRIHSASYAAVDAVNSTLTGLTDYHNNYQYDADGNLLGLVRYGDKTATGVHVMDSLIYGYAAGSHDNKLLKLSDYAANNYTNDIANNTTGSARYQYDLTGNTIKDLVSGQDTVEWNLYNKVTATENRAARNSMSFVYDGAGNRVAKYFKQTTDSNYSENNEYYVHDAQGNILAIYKDKNVHTVAPLTDIQAHNAAFRMAVGNSNTFNNEFITPMFSGDRAFRSAVIDGSFDSPDFVSTQLDHPVSYFMARQPDLYYGLLFSKPIYSTDMIAVERSGADTILTPALASCMDYVAQMLLSDSTSGSSGDSTTGSHHHHHHLSGYYSEQPELTYYNGDIRFSMPRHHHHRDNSFFLDVKAYSSDDSKMEAAEGIVQMLGQIYVDSALSAHAVGLLCGIDGGDSLLRDMTIAILEGSAEPDSNGNIDTAALTTMVDSVMSSVDCNAFTQIISAAKIDPSLLAQTLLLTADLNYPALFRQYIHEVITDTMVITNPEVGSYAGSALPQCLAVFGDRGRIIQFFENDSVGPQLLAQMKDKSGLLGIVYDADRGAYINAYGAALGDDHIDAAVGSTSRLSSRTYFADAQRLTGIGMSPYLVALVDELKSEDFSLAEHDIYGSSRIGIKEYYPQQVGIKYVIDPTSHIGSWTDTMRLWSQLPWYSLEYQDVIREDSMNLYNNAHTGMYYAHHILGQKQFELTAVTGNVLATVSDKRAAGTFSALPGTTLTAGALANIVTWKPVVVTAHDYYPFGEYMPGRYMSDSDSHCVTTTVTEMVHETYYTTEPAYHLYTAGLMVAFGGSTFTESSSGGGTALRMSSTSGGGVTYTPILVTPVAPNRGPDHVTVEVGRVTGQYTLSVTDDGGTVLGSTNVNHYHGGNPILVVPIKDGDGGLHVVITNVTDTAIHWQVDTTGTGGHHWNGGGTDPWNNGNTDTAYHHWPVDTTGSHSGGGGVNPCYTCNEVVIITVQVPHDTLIAENVVTTVCNNDYYRYGYNTMMKVNEIAGLGNHYSALYWDYDSRTGRRWNRDPVMNASLSSYATFEDNPIAESDRLGDDPDNVTKGFGGKKVGTSDKPVNIAGGGVTAKRIPSMPIAAAQTYGITTTTGGPRQSNSTPGFFSQHKDSGSPEGYIQWNKEGINDKWGFHINLPTAGPNSKALEVSDLSRLFTGAGAAGTVEQGPAKVLDLLDFLMNSVLVGDALQGHFHGENGNTTHVPKAGGVQENYNGHADTFRYGSQKNGILMYRSPKGFDSFGRDTNNKRSYPNNCKTCP